MKRTETRSVVATERHEVKITLADLRLAFDLPEDVYIEVKGADYDSDILAELHAVWQVVTRDEDETDVSSEEAWTTQHAAPGV